MNANEIFRIEQIIDEVLSECHENLDNGQDAWFPYDDLLEDGESSLHFSSLEHLEKLKDEVSSRVIGEKNLYASLLNSQTQNSSFGTYGALNQIGQYKRLSDEIVMQNSSHHLLMKLIHRVSEVYDDRYGVKDLEPR